MDSGPHYATNELLSSAALDLDAVASRGPAWRRRRLWWSTWRRFCRWEYWPIWAIYPPVVLYILWLGVRHRGWTTFTAVNPGMPAASGVVGMSKSSILQGLANAGDRIAKWTVIEPGSFPVRNAALRLFMAENGLSYPIVLKPDRGERGEGVVIAKSALQLEGALREISGALVAQAYVPGLEFGVFYIRRTGDRNGEIFALTEKHDVYVAGNGGSSLRDLILADERAVEMARFFLWEFRDRLTEVPPKGERVRLSELGTHCRGSLFLDGDGLVTSRLEQAIDAVSQTYGGFYFGRYDVRADSVEALQQGEFKVIELNGVTSEATGMYDPRHSIWHGWRTLCRQWEIAFEIGDANRARGARVWSLGELVRLLREHGKA